MDLHSPQIQGFFKIPVDHLYAMPVLVDYFREKDIPDLVVASPDVGFGKQAYKYAEMLHAPGPPRVVFGNKVRRSHDEHAEMLDIVGDVRGNNVLIVDDFTISGGTLIEMAIACKERGCKDVYACVSHGVFSPGSAAKIAHSPIKELVFTDTIEYRFEVLPPCCKVISVASLFADAIMSIHRRESVSRLFNY
jgi:ribose-phosphate pyrophosphokinase